MSDMPRGELMNSVRQATVEDYKAWLMGYLRNGGVPTHFYDRPFKPRNFHVLTSDAHIPALHGANSMKIIVPAGVQASGGGGHNDIYRMDGYQADGSVIPLYADIIEEVVLEFPQMFNPPTLNHLNLLFRPECVACDWEGEIQNTESAARAECEDHQLGYGDDHLPNIARPLVTDSGQVLYTYY